MATVRSPRARIVEASALLLLAVGSIVLASCGGSTKQAARTASTCSWASAGAPARQVGRPTDNPPRTGTVQLTVATTHGPMSVALDRAAAPCTVASFESLARQHYFDGTACNRLVTASIYVLQCGDPTGQGFGGPGYTIPDEATGGETYPAGTIAMARTAQPNSGGSQFFIVYRDSANLMRNLGSLQYTVFGKVTAGLDVVTKVATAGTADGTIDGPPKLPITLTSVH